MIPGRPPTTVDLSPPEGGSSGQDSSGGRLSKKPPSSKKAAGKASLPEEIEADRIFAHALELPSRDKLAYVEEACEGRPRLLAMVQELLELADDDFDPLLDAGRQHQEGWLEEAEGAFTTDLGGQLLGPYRLVREIGRGGMGVVFLAERADGQFEQQVALKLVQLGSSAGRLSRFRRERQILATLDDVRIARLLDGGVTVEGLPFLVMEYVDGEPIDLYCEKQQLSIRERLQLFLETCHAVSAAHRQLVVHRDLKPSNVLVASDGAVKLLDFGIAKLISPDDVPESSAEWTIAMTPSYASPEQFLGQPITVASDVYQLGLMFFRLLSGRLPYDVRTGGAAKAQRLICEVPPPKPSAALRELSRDEPSTVASGAFPVFDEEDLKAWERSLKGDLDNIAVKALAKSPKDRYSSVDALIADVERYLAGQPVAARQPTLAYVTGKFISRHRLAVTSAALVALLFVGLVATYTAQLRRERDRAESARIVAEQSKEQAERLRDEAESLSGSLVDLFSLADPERGPDDPVDALNLLERSVERLRGELDEHPLATARLLHTLGEIYTKLDREDKAAELIDEVLAVRRAHLERGHPEIAETANQLGMIYGHLRRFDEADALLSEALMAREAAGEVELVALTLNNLGNLRWRQGELQDAESYHRRAFEIREALPEPDPVRIGDSANNLGVLLNALSRSEEAIPFFRRAIELHEEAYGPDHATPAVARNNLGIAALKLGDWDEAEAQFRRAAESWQKAYGATHTRTLRAQYNVANTLRWQGQLEACAAALARQLEIQESLDPPVPAEVGRTLSTLGAVLTDLGDFDQAATLLDRSVAVREQLFGAEHRSTLISRYSRARLWRRVQDPRAEPELQLLLAKIEAIYGPDSTTTASVLHELALALLASGGSASGEVLLRRAVAIRQEKLPKIHPMRRQSEEALASLTG